MADASAKDWPHDPDGDIGSEGMRNFDMAVLSKMVEEDEFPIQKDEFVDEFGDWPVRINHKTVVSVADIFEDVEEDSFETKIEFHKATGRAIRKTGLWEYVPDT